MAIAKRPDTRLMGPRAYGCVPWESGGETRCVGYLGSVGPVPCHHAVGDRKAIHCGNDQLSGPRWKWSRERQSHPKTVGWLL